MNVLYPKLAFVDPASRRASVFYVAARLFRGVLCLEFVVSLLNWELGLGFSCNFRASPGLKRPFEDEELQELPFKNPRHFGYSNKLTQFADTIPRCNTPEKPHISVEVDGGFRNYQWDEAFDTDALSDFTHLVDKDFETSAPLSLVTSTSNEENTGSVAAFISPVPPEYFDLDFPRRMFAPVEDAYSLLLDQSPRRQVLLGPNHQANVPSWGGHMKKDRFARNGASDANDNDYEEIMMGACVIPMPDSDLSANNSGKVGAGRTECSCLDRGSLRRVQQHAIEA
ncbi:uncharacterized protein LOC111289062 [Durio zibethinus]|uniref:Uncharacterized protein LOC111289062 n=1 Tax=Durio zibethinus TaxID=66656 RepID=A0A6P5Y6T7_DURZI|nr:uncharacterized protein LOC111289062 [Durio zibethinus]